nr:TPA_exp: polyketide synthase [uncultured bacterium]
MSEDHCCRGENEIAIIGMSCRFPGAKNIDAFWKNLRDGVESVSFFSDEELKSAGVSPELLENPNYVKAAPMLDDVDLFDAHFFEYAPKSVIAMDPQHRLFLECCWESLENAGYSVENYSGSIGVYAGAGGNMTSYLMAYKDRLKGAPGGVQHIGTDKDFLTTRVSFKLNLTGPSVTVQSACSTSLVAVHMGCQSILSGECDMILAGGVTVRVPHNEGYLYEDFGIFSPDGHCRAFDCDAQGTIFGSGVGVVALKRLSAALDDRDHIYGVIKATGVNNDGNGKVSYAASSGEGQAQIVAEVLELADVQPETITYIEAHGTGTTMGDPVEINAFSRVFKTCAKKKQFCAVGSVKTNIGHTEAASGIAGLIKTTLSLYYKEIPASLHFRKANKKIDFKRSPFYVNSALRKWKNGNGVRRAGVNALGIGGTNAFALLEEAPARIDNKKSPSKPFYLLALSAKTVWSLEKKIEDLKEWLGNHHAQEELENICYTLNAGRAHFKERCALVVGSKEELADALQQIIEKKECANYSTCQDRVETNLPETTSETIFEKILDNEHMDDKAYYETLMALANVYVGNGEIDWEQLHCGEAKKRIPLPSYPFERKRYWVPENTLKEAKQDDDRVTSADLSMMSPVWDVVSLPEEKELFPVRTERIVMIGAVREHKNAIREIYPNALETDLSSGHTIEMMTKHFEKFSSLTHLLWIVPDESPHSLVEESLIENQNRGVLKLFRMIKALLSLGYGLKSLSLTVITIQTQIVRKGDHANPTHASVHGMIGSLAKEYPHWKIRLLDMERDREWPVLDMFSMPCDEHGSARVYRGGEWFKQSILPIFSPQRDPQSPYRERGVYIVIGGTGGIGEAWSRSMIEKYKAKIIWVGRRKKDREIEAKLEALSGLGPVPTYIQADAANQTALRKVYEETRKKHNQIHGVIHSAIVLLDHGLANMDEERFRSALRAKVDISVRLAQVFQKEPLDFVLFFSSLQSFTKAPGQSNYAAGCTFKDAFARRLELDWSCAVKVVNWGYWGSVGIVKDPSYGEPMKRAGLGSIEPEQGLKALETFLQGTFSQVVLIKIIGKQRIDSMRLNEQISVYPKRILRRSRTLYLCSNEGICRHPPKNLYDDINSMDKLLMEYLPIFLKSIGPTNDKKGTSRKPSPSLLPLYNRWLDSSLEFIKDNDKKLTADRSDGFALFWDKWNQRKVDWNEDAGQRARTVLVETCLRALPEILTGKKRASDVLFPNSSLHLVEGIYFGNAVSDYFNETIHNIAAAYLQKRIEGRLPDEIVPLRILEIGAGTGGTTSGLLAKFRPYGAYIEEYCYTDVSHAFLRHAEEKYAPGNPFLRTQIFDVGKPIADQKIKADHYDLVIATNVLHATKNIRQSLRHIKATLRKHGLLLLNEQSMNSLFAHLTFGLLDGWWLYEDETLRIPGCPCVYPETWANILKDEGWDPVLFPAQSVHAAGQQIVVAESDGIVRQPVHCSTEEPADQQSPAIITKTVATDIALPDRRRKREPEKESGQGLHACVSRTILEEVSKSLNIPEGEVAHKLPFSEYGLDSILGIRFVKNLNDRFGIEMNTTVLFDQPSVERLTNHIMASYQIKSIDKDSGSNSMTADSASAILTLPRRNEPTAKTMEIAVIGMSGQLPNAADVETFWENLLEERDGVDELPAPYLDQEKYFRATQQTGKTYCKWGGILRDRDCFDPIFFNIPREEASCMNPHQRLILQEGWKALEDAGYNPNTFSSFKMGIYIGAEPMGHTGSFTGGSEAIIASRLSYFLNFKGPAFVVNTGCSSSGVALHLACESLRSGECDAALAGGVSAAMGPAMLVNLSEVQLLSPTGKCNTFDQSADGTVFSEGVGMVVLKRLQDALADRDPVYGVIEASGMNHNGSSNGITALSGLAQIELLESVYNRFQINPEHITYFEAHAMGTRLGDSIEANAIVRAFERFTGKKNFCAVGSLKSHIGHTASSSGVVGLIKILLSMRNHKLPGILHYEKLNPMIEFEDSPFYIQDQLSEWISDNGLPLRAALNTFGYSGSNVHFVIREHLSSGEAQEESMAFDQDGSVFVPLSAKNKDRLKEMAQNLHACLVRNRHAFRIADVAYTLQVGREAMRERAIFFTRSCLDLAAQLKEFINGGKMRGHGQGRQNESSFSSQENLQAALTKCVVAKNQEKVAELWRQGLAVDWSLLYEYDHPQGTKPQRIHLPSYPFAKESYPTPEIELSKNSIGEVREVSNRFEAKPLRSSGKSVAQCSVDQLKATIVSVIREVLLIHKECELDEESSFLDLGLDSIRVVRFIRKLSGKIDVPLRETLVFDYPTIQALATYIAQRHGQPASTLKSRTGKREIPRTPGFKEQLGYIVKEYEELVPLQIEGGGPLLFCIHSMSGDVSLYSKLAESAGNRFRVIGIKSRGFLSDSPPLTSLKEMGRYYAEIMMNVVSDGPFHLFGSSMGGTVAYEAARFLQIKNKSVKSLWLAEAPLVENNEDEALWNSDEAHNWVMNANFLMIAMLHMDPEFRRRKAEGKVKWPELEIPFEAIAGVAKNEIATRLASLIRERGVMQTGENLLQRLRSMARIHLANLNGLSCYRASLLREPNACDAFFLRTRLAHATSKEVYNPDYLVKVQEAKGSLLPFFKGWEKLLPKLKTETVTGENHFDILSSRTTTQHIADRIAETMGIASNEKGDKLLSSTSKGLSHYSGCEDKIAVIGMSGQFPGAQSLEDYWALLRNGEVVISEFPEDRDWNFSELHNESRCADRMELRHGGFLSDIDCFDPVFFQMSPKEAEMIDPAERLFLQESWRAIEDAGIDPASLSGKQWGVFCGGGGDYTLRLKEATGISPHVTVSSLPGRVSYSFNLTGPAVSVDAGCASSGLAVAQACDHLILNKCEAAIAGGVLIYSTPNLIHASHQAQLLTNEDKSYAFDERACGMMPGEAVGVLVLKPLAQALADDDRIHGVIEGWGNNHNGRTNGMAAPRAESETTLFSDVYQRFQINPETISMVEANATGTPLGDAIEFEALTAAFRKFTRERQYCSLGSVENNIGHAFQCSGMSHIMKVLLALRHREIPPTVNVEQPNPRMDFADSPFFIHCESRPWNPQAGLVRRAAVSSFGGTGTNVHLVIAEPPSSGQPMLPEESSMDYVVIVLSAATNDALKQKCRDLNAFLDDHGETNLAQLSANLLLRRGHFSERCALVVCHQKALQAGLSSVSVGKEPVDGFMGSVSGNVSRTLEDFGRMMIRKISKEEKPDKESILALANVYVQGVCLDAFNAFSEAETFPLSLPGYPFAKRRCWISSQTKKIIDSKPLGDGVLATIQETLASITGLKSDEIDANAPFSRFGLDSLTSTRLLASVNECFSVNLQLADLLEHNTMLRLAAVIEQENPRAKYPRPVQQTKISPALISNSANWLSDRLSQWPDSLHVEILKSADRPDRVSSLESCNSSLAKLINAGIATFHEGRDLFLLSHRSINIQAVLGSISLEEQNELLEHLPLTTLIAPVSQEQERNLYHSERMHQSAWNVQHLYELETEELDIPILNQALSELVVRHDILRTRYLTMDDGWAQIVAPKATLELQVLEMPTLAAFQAFIGKERNRLINIETLPIFKAWCSRIDEKYYIGFITHHSLSDAFTLTILFTDLMAVYTALMKQHALPAWDGTEQYWQYALQQFDQSVYRRPEVCRYWKERLANFTHVMQLPYSQDPQMVEDDMLDMADHDLTTLPAALSDKIRRFHQDYEITPTQLFTTAIAMLLIYGCGNVRAMLRFIINQRDRISIANTPGEFTNVLFLPFEIDLKTSVICQLQQVKQKSMDGLRHAKIDFSELLGLTGLDNYENYYQPSGDVIVNSADIDAGTLNASIEYGRSIYADTVTMQGKSSAGEQALATLFFQIIKMNQSIHLFTSYRKSVFDKSRIQELSKLVVRLVEQMIHDPEQGVDAMLLKMNDEFGNIRKGEGSCKFLTECQRVNHVKKGRPVFWIHGGYGDASVYIPLADKLDRPFYGIQAKGLFDDKTPLSGVKEIAAFYRSLIQSIQPEGPYDLGGYSIGGTYAYEVAYQFQLGGQVVQSLTLVDPLFPPHYQKLRGDYYDLLHYIALGLVDMTFRNNPEKSIKKIDALKKPEIGDADLLESFVLYCLKAGINKPEAWVRDYIKKMVKIQEGFQIGDYIPAPLDLPVRSVRYFKNRDGLFFGKHAAHINSRRNDPLLGVDYWSEWKTLLPHIEYEEVAVDNHLMLFDDDAALQAICDYCRHIYHPEDAKSVATRSDSSLAKSADGEELEKEVIQYLKEQVASILKCPVDLIQVDELLGEYGIDSLLATQLTHQLQKVFGALSVTLFFEYRTIKGLAGYFLASHGETMRTLFDVNHITPASVAPDGYSEEQIAAEPLVPSFSRALDIAIIGLSGCYPQAANVEAFWDNLRNGKDSITEVPPDRWDWQAYYSEDRSQPSAHHSKHGGFLDSVDQFDPLFFNISPREAELMDPQERLFLEHAWMALEDAGYRPEDLRGNPETHLSFQVGVYAGVMYREYQFLGVEAGLCGDRSVADMMTPASVANRVSYTLNLHGPSMSVDTACSSSLTSLHLACQDLKCGRTDMALSGGVSLSIHPNKYLGLSRGQFISPNGRCESFGGGVGFIPGEGVGIVLLKRLADAQRDGDHIYGVIKGSAINHGGKTNGYTVPNPDAQHMVIARALDESGVDPRMISYIEAHGTGTELGDPIEIAGLRKAFGKFTREPQCCWIGSAKSNIGHCESAAGIAGLTKVLLQMRYKQIAPSLHSDILNPHIDFSTSPFAVNQKLREWKRPEVDGTIIPRIAGISSFGGGGSNAHVIVEEYCNARTDIQCSPVVDAGQYHGVLEEDRLIVLSAKNEERLKEIAQNLYTFLQKNRSQESFSIRDIAYTLQIGRESMEERLGILVASVEDLKEKLNAFIDGEDGLEGMFRGRAKPMSNNADDGIVRQKSTELLEGWVNGMVIDWAGLYGKAKPSRVSLPTYPFSRERYWIDLKDRALPLGHELQLHPLVHTNTSVLSEQRYSSMFNGQEFFFANDSGDDQKVLSNLVYLEMARAALDQAVGSLNRESKGIQFKNVVWGTPIAVDGHPQEVHISLFPNGDEQVQFEIYTHPSSENPDSEDIIVHGQGEATSKFFDGVTPLDIEGLQAKLNKVHVSGMQGIKALYCDGGEALAELQLSPSGAAAEDQFVLHPELLEVTLHTAAKVLFFDKTSNKMEVQHNSEQTLKPIALESVDIMGKCPAAVWAWIRLADSKPGIQKLDISLCDDRGMIFVKMKGVSFTLSEKEDASAESVGTFMGHPAWKEEVVPADIESPEYAEHLILLCGLDAYSTQTIQANIKGGSCFHLHSNSQCLASRYADISIQVFERIKKILKQKPLGNILFQVIVPAHGAGRLFSGLSGLLKTAQLENPKIIGQLIEINPDATEKGLLEIVKENSYCPAIDHISYQCNQRFAASFEEASTTDENARIPWKEGGVYLITGGAGGLGFIFAEEIARQIKNAKIFLTGRSPLSREKQHRINVLATLGARVEYRQTDVRRKSEVDALIREMDETFGEVIGILHSAGIIQDNFILKKTNAEFKTVLSPKVSGAVNLHQATLNHRLEFFILFSSGSGAMGNVGQADYSAANAFMDAYASYRNDLAKLGECYGQTLAVNWPLWEEGGMGMDLETEKAMRRNMGMEAMDSPAGIQAFYHSLASEHSQMMVIAGNLPQIRQYVFKRNSKEKTGADEKLDVQVDKGVLQEKVLHQLKRMLGYIIKLSTDRIKSEDRLEHYGVDSVMITQLNQRLETSYGAISKTLFYEYQTLSAVAAHLIEVYPEASMSWVGMKRRGESESAGLLEKVEIPALVSLKSRSRNFSRYSPADTKGRNREPMAIIGMSGCYAQAETMEAYWENLKTGRDCITEIPQDRWSLNGFFHDVPQEAVAQGKSYSKWGSFLDGFSQFDPLFFNISPGEAMNMDPQERLFLQSSWEVMENAGYTRETLQKGFDQRVGVFVGITKTGFNLYGTEMRGQGQTAYPDTSFSSVANRVSYFLDLRGPSMPIDTMCSSSLTAIHEACEHLYREECEMAIAGGVNLYVHPSSYIGMCAMHMLSNNGRCKSFGKGANGFVPGEGVGVILLKRLSRAMEDQDWIHAVIRGTCVNHGGKTNGYTVPNPNAQGALIRETLERAGVHARTISYIEAHGTGTELGDPIEVTGLTQAFQKDTSDTGFCALGSVKSNLGHLEAAAGIAGLMKILLQMKHGKLVPSLHARELNPNIDFEKTPFTIQQKLEDWKRPTLEIDGVKKEYPRIAGISSFGAGGSNAHVLIEEYDESTGIRNISCGTYLIVLSARNNEGLRAYTESLLGFIECHSDINLADVAYTLQVGREAMEERLALMINSLAELAEKLQGFLDGQNQEGYLYHGQAKGMEDTLALLAADDDVPSLIEIWAEKGKYSRILDLWVKGLSVDWNVLYGGGKPRRIALPTYPFARENYWFNQETVGLFMYRPFWKAAAVPEQVDAPRYSQHVVIVCDFEPFAAESTIRSQIKGVTFVRLQSGRNNSAMRFEHISVQVFERLKAILENGSDSLVLVQIVISSEGEGRLYCGLSGLLKTAHLENPKLVGQVVIVDSSETEEEMTIKIRENCLCPEDAMIRYQGGQRQVIAWKNLFTCYQSNRIPWKDNGVYLITGGAGGLGLIFAREIAEKANNPVLILVGRSLLDTDRKKQLKALEGLGARIVYRQVDVCRKQNVDALIQYIERELGEIRGVLHSAGIIRDNFILKKNKAEFKSVLLPKVSGTMNLDHAVQRHDLDFFILFSSGAGVLGNSGQADYSTANAFMDAYAEFRNGLVAAGERKGRTFSVNWPLWKDGGMQINETIGTMLKNSMGLTAMETHVGIKVFYQVLAAKWPRVMVLTGEREKIQQQLSMRTIRRSSRGVDKRGLKEKVLENLKGLVGDVVKLPENRIRPEDPLENYGINSVMLMQLNQKLLTVFDDISQTLFLEYQTLNDLADHLMRTCPIACADWAKVEDCGIREKIEIRESVRLEESSTIHSTDGIDEPIAIIGVSGRYPQASNLNEYWENLKAGKVCISEIPASRWHWKDYCLNDPEEARSLSESSGKWGGFLEDCYQFDPLFFKITPRDAENMDPQERIFLEESWKAMEDSGHAPSTFSSHTCKRAGVFAGITKQGFNLHARELAGSFPSTSFSSLVNRVSYHLNLQGPSIPIDAMCSSALVAIHEACEYLRRGKGEFAIAGGVNLYLHPSTYIELSRAQMISQTRRCAAFGKEGGGFVPGEGVGVVILKPYRLAVRDRNSVYALIRGTAVNHDGKTNGYNVPNPRQQEAVIQEALEQSDLDPKSIGYIESAANGSELADVAEAAALLKVFGKRNGTIGNYRMGSVKPNLGHSESASGMSQLTKVILSLKHKTLVPTVIEGELNPNIPFDQLPFKLQQEISEWEPIIINGEEVPRRAGITGVGAGGVNAHIVVEEYLPDGKCTDPQTDLTEPVLFTLSAKNKNRLMAYVEKWLDYLDANPAMDLAQAAYTLQVGREAMPGRLAIICVSTVQLHQRLKAWKEEGLDSAFCYSGDVRKSDPAPLENAVSALEQKDLSRIASSWVSGSQISWESLHRGEELFRRTGLPTYPFARKNCEIKSYPTATGKRQTQSETSKVEEYYTHEVRSVEHAFGEEYLTFAPFTKKILGFSFTRVWLNRERYPDEYRLIKSRQIELRQVLFCREEFGAIENVLDFGCGHGTDVIQIAAYYPHIQTHGFTITEEQAKLGQRRIAEKKLSARATIFHKNSARDPFPDLYDLIVGIEVSFHIPDKDGLFRNIASSLKPGGRVLLADYIANLRGPIVDVNVGVSIPTQEDWIDLLSRHHLVIDEIIDVSPQIANFLYDPDFEENMEGLPKVTTDVYRNHVNQFIALEKGWITYSLFKLQKDHTCTDAERRRRNEDRLSRQRSYPKALMEMRKRGHIPYPIIADCSNVENISSLKDTELKKNEPDAELAVQEACSQ